MQNLGFSGACCYRISNHNRYLIMKSSHFGSSSSLRHEQFLLESLETNLTLIWICNMRVIECEYAGTCLGLACSDTRAQNSENLKLEKEQTKLEIPPTVGNCYTSHSSLVPLPGWCLQHASESGSWHFMYVHRSKKKLGSVPKETSCSWGEAPRKWDVLPYWLPAAVVLLPNKSAVWFSSKCVRLVWHWRTQ